MPQQRPYALQDESPKPSCKHSITLDNHLLDGGNFAALAVAEVSGVMIPASRAETSTKSGKGL